MTDYAPKHQYRSVPPFPWCVILRGLEIVIAALIVIWLAV